MGPKERGPLQRAVYAHRSGTRIRGPQLAGPIKRACTGEGPAGVESRIMLSGALQHDRLLRIILIMLSHYCL